MEKEIYYYKMCIRDRAVFSLRGKLLNSYGLTKEIVYKYEELNLLQAALNIEDGLEELRYNNVIVATDCLLYTS